MPQNLIRKVCVVSATIILSMLNGMCENANHPLGGRSSGMGNTSVTLNDFWSVHNNQAGLAGYKNISAGFFYEDRFIMKELGLKALAFVLPVKSGVFGLNFNTFGYSQYNETKVGLAYAKGFGKIFSAGIQLDYLRTGIAENYGNKNVFTFEIGLMSKLNEKVILAAHVFNPINVRLEQQYDERIQSVYKFGVSYLVSEKLLLAIETEKSRDFKPLVRGGLEYKIIDQAIARIGYSTLPSMSGTDDFSIASLYSFGFGLNFQKLIIDFSASVHQTLGWSPSVSLIYKFNKGK
jgi:hypothetical protein